MSDRDQEKIESMQVDSLIWSEPEQSSFQQQQSFPIYSVSKGLKNPKILQHIKPDYGSLGEFMKNVVISKDILLHNRKKKNELQEDLEQKKVRSILKNQNLEKVLKHDSSTPIEKTVASKMIVENLFENNFGTTLQNFCSPIRYDSFKHSHTSVADLSGMLDNMMADSKKQNLLVFDSKNEAPILSRKNHMFSTKEIEVLTLTERANKLSTIFQKYTNIKKNQTFPPLPTDNAFSPLDKGVLTFSSLSLSFQNVAPTLLRVQMQSIRSLKLINIQMSQDLLSLMLDYFTDAHCTEFRQLVIQKCSFSHIERVAERIKIFIEESKVSRVQLTSLGLSNKDFCIIALGIGSRSSFEFLGLRDNCIGEVSKKSLDVLLKFHKETKFCLSKNPIEREIKGRPGYSRCFC